MSLRLRVRVRSRTVQIDDVSASTTLAGLRTAICDAAELSRSDAEGLKLLVGFPPRALDKPADAPIGGDLRSGDMLRAIIAGEADVGAKGAASVKAEAKKRRAAPSRPRAAAVKARSAASKPRTGVHSLHAPTTKRARPKPGGTVHTLAGGRAKARRQQRPPGPKREPSAEDQVSSLLQAVSDAREGDRRLGDLFREKLDHEYEERKANARVAAALCGNYTIEDDRSSLRLDGTPVNLRVTFSLGIEGRGAGEDVVPSLPRQLLRQLIELEIDSESTIERRDGTLSVVSDNVKAMLRPHVLAVRSPVTFWNLIRHTGCPDVESALEALLPQRDWSFVGTRQRQLSAKAKANREREEEERRAERDAREAKQARSSLVPAEEVAAAQRDRVEAIFSGRADVLKALREAKVTKLKDVAVFCSSKRMLQRILARVRAAEAAEALLADVAEDEVKAWAAAAKEAIAREAEAAAEAAAEPAA